MNYESIPWENVIKELIYTILIIPVGTSDIKRGFSVLNHFLTKRRSVLSTTHIEDITRIRVNGPSISTFNPVPYALHWLAASHTEADDERATRNSDTQKKINSVLF